MSIMKKEYRTPLIHVLECMTEKMISASEKIIEAIMEYETETGAAVEAPPVSTLEEVFYTSYVEGAQITMQEAMDFLTGDLPPRCVEEQMIANNRMAGSYARASAGARLPPDGRHG